MISREQKWVFVHVPKVAGQSIEKALLPHTEGRDGDLAKVGMVRNRIPWAGPPRLDHRFWWEYARDMKGTTPLWEDCFSFGFVRNPWERLYSEWRFRNPSRMFRLLKGDWSFREFVLRYFPRPWNDNYITGSDNYRHVVPQWKFLCHEDGRPAVTFIGRFERLEDDFAEAIRSLGLPPGECRLPKVNQAKRAKGEGYRGAYDDEMRERVARLYARDIEWFGYEF